MEDDQGKKVIPVKETNSTTNISSKKNMEDERVEMLPSHEQRIVSRWSREELEDRYFVLYDENIILKKHGRKQEDKIKRMTTKLLRLISDRKKQEQEKGVNSMVKKRDIETEQLIEDLQTRIRELERTNKFLHEKLAVARQQLATQLKRPVPVLYRHISSRVDTGVSKPTLKASASLLHHSDRTNRSPYHRYSQSPLVENRCDSDMEEGNIPFRRQIEALEQEIVNLREKLQSKEIEHEEVLATIKSQFTQEQRIMLQENVSVIRLQRELKHKASQMIVTEAHCTELEKNLDSVRKSHQEALAQLDLISQQLSNEQQENLKLRNELKSLTASNIVIAELHEKISYLEKENKILGESNNKLIESALNSKNSTKVASTENALKLQVSQLDNALQASSTERNELIERLNKEKGLQQKQEEELNQIKLSYSQLKEKHEKLEEKLKLISQDSELEGALSKLHREKEKVMQSQILSRTVEENQEMLQQKLVKAQADHVETINELEKTRSMLVIQHKINQDYKQEVENLTNRLSQVQKEYEARILEQTHILELRDVHIQRLERQLKEIAHCNANRKFNLDLNVDRNNAKEFMKTNAALVSKAVESLEQSSNFSNDGLNELHVKIINCNGVLSRQGGNPSAYCVYKFFNKPDHDTSIIKFSSNPQFDDHMIYHVEMDLQLDEYLRNKALEIYVFDDNDAELATYLGMASIPLLQLTNNEPITGEFELTTANDVKNGTICIAMYWLHLYTSLKQEQTKFSSDVQKDSVSQPSERTEDISVPTPKPRAIKVTTSLNEKTNVKMNKKPPPVPKKKQQNETQKLKVTSPKSDPINILKDNSQFIFGSDTSSDSDVIIAGSIKGKQVTVPTNLQQQRNSKTTDKLSHDCEIEPAPLKLNDSVNDISEETDSDVMFAPGVSSSPQKQLPSANAVTITVTCLTLFDNAKVLENNDVQMLFVEYRFLDFPPEDLETPYALPKSKANQKIMFNFRKVFHFNPSKNVQQCQNLLDMLTSSNKNRIKFTVVSEPSEDNQELDCEDIGFAYIDLRKIFRNQKDVIEENIAVYDATNTSIVIGQLIVTVEAYSALKTLQEWMKK